jgi:hypothetical protein
MFFSIIFFCLALWLGNHYIHPLFGYGLGIVAAIGVAVRFAWLGLVKPLFFPTRCSKPSEGDTEPASRIMEQSEAKNRREMADTARYLAEHGMASPEWRQWLPQDYKQKEIEDKQKEIEAEVQARFNRKAWWTSGTKSSGCAPKSTGSAAKSGSFKEPGSPRPRPARS